MTEKPTFLTHKYDRDDVILKTKETVFNGFAKVTDYTLTHPSFNGQLLPTFSREVYERKNAAICLPYDPQKNRIILLEQFRAGLYAAGEKDCWAIEPIAGTIDSTEETAMDVAHRESLEEANCVIQRLIPAGGYYPSGGSCSEHIECFIGICNSKNIGGIHGLTEEAEDIRAFTIDFDEAVTLALEGHFNNLPLTNLIFWLALKKNTQTFDL